MIATSNHELAVIRKKSLIPEKADGAGYQAVSDHPVGNIKAVFRNLQEE